MESSGRCTIGQEINVEDIVARGVEYFMQGYNCSQSVSMAYAAYYGIDETLMARLSGSFGGGIGRMRETCGTACGMFLLAGLEITKNGESYPDAELKRKNYELVQALAARFKEQTGSLLCKELLGLIKAQNGTKQVAPLQISAIPEERTAEYYKKRPCVRMVEVAIRTYFEVALSKK